MHTLTHERLIEIIADADFTPAPYSGRGMYGRRCVSFVIENETPLNHALADLVEGAVDTDEASDILRGMMRDSMGRGAVLYWPAVSWPEVTGTEG